MVKVAKRNIEYIEITREEEYRLYKNGIISIHPKYSHTQYIIKVI